MKNYLTVLIITKNEEKDLERCLSSVKNIADAIVVVDSLSTDKTVEIAKKFGAKVYKREFDNYAAQRNFGLSKIKDGWVFSIDADEEIEINLQKEILEVKSSEKYDGFLIPRRNFLLGQEIKYSRWSPDRHIWLFRKGTGEWRGDIHEEVIVEGNVGIMKNAKIHHSYETVAEFMAMVNKYTEFEAEQKNESGVKFPLIKMWVEPIYIFVLRFIYKKGFLDGYRGFVLSYMMSIYSFIVWAKLWERQNQK